MAHEEFQITRIAAVGIEREPVVSARQHTYSPTFELRHEPAQTVDHNLRIGLHVGHIEMRRRFRIQRRLQNSDTRTDEYFMLLRLEQINRLGISVRAMVEHPESIT